MKKNRIDVLLDQTKNWQGDSDALSLSIFSIALAIRARNILELGSRSGNTSLPLLSAAIENGGRVTSVDIDKSSRRRVENFLFNFFSTKEIDFWKFVDIDANQFLDEAIDLGECYDLVYVDDWHSYDHVKKEFERLDKLVTPSSVILVHDTMYANYQPHYHTDIAVKEGQWANGGPYRAVAELNQNFWEFATIPASNGLTIVRKKYSKLYNV